MHQTNLCGWLWRSALALTVVIGGVDSSFAGWGHGGSWGGGSSGGWGGSSGGYSDWGGSSGGWGSSGGYGGSSGGWGGSSGGGGRGGLFARWHANKHARRNGGSNGGSSGGYADFGSSGGGYGSSGGYGGSSGGWGGGAYYSPSMNAYEGEYMPSDYVPADGMPKTVPPADARPADEPPATDGAAARADGALIVEVPADAKIYVNDRLTSTPGQVREYVSRNLVRGFNYSYEVRAELERDGKVVSETKRIELRAGQNARLAFNFAPAAESVETSITVNVPANAKVNLGGNDTNATGELRTFRTSALEAGSEWKDYKIVVTWEVDGRQLTKEQTFDLRAGDDKQVSFDFETTSVADAR